MSSLNASAPTPHSYGSRLVPPALPPAPPANGTPPPSPGWPAPDPGSGDSSVLGDLFTECLNDLALIRTTLETHAVFPDDRELEAEMRSLVEDARLRLVNRLQAIDCRATDGGSGFSDVELQGFHRAMIDVIRREVRWSVPETWVWGNARTGSRDAFRYHLRLRHPYEDPCTESPAALLHRILEDLTGELAADANFVSLEQFEHEVFRKFVGVLFACLVGASPSLRDDD